MKTVLSYDHLHIVVNYPIKFHQNPFCGYRGVALTKKKKRDGWEPFLSPSLMAGDTFEHKGGDNIYPMTSNKLLRRYSYLP